MTRNKTFPTYMVPADGCHRHDVHHKFECECGNEQSVDEHTECSVCGAHYRLVEQKMLQLAPPVEVWE